MFATYIANTESNFDVEAWRMRHVCSETNSQRYLVASFSYAQSEKLPIHNVLDSATHSEVHSEFLTRALSSSSSSSAFFLISVVFKSNLLLLVQ